MAEIKIENLSFSYPLSEKKVLDKSNEAQYQVPF